jgi:hypothetical protein
VDHGSVPNLLQLHQQAPNVPLGQLQLGRRLLLRNQLLLCFLQHHQAIPIALGHQ